MTVNSGTHVIDKIVTPDDQDTFPTHDQDTNKGGYRGIDTFANMNLIPAERRTAGMEVRVIADSTPTLNGVYILDATLLIFTLEDVTILSDPPDAGWGTGSSDTHANTGVTVGDTPEEYVDKILTHLDNTAPPLPPLINALTLDIPSLYTAHKQGEATHISIDNIQILVQPIGTLSGKFGDAKAGIVLAKIDTATEGTKTLTAGPAGDDNGIDGALTLSGEETFNTIYQQIQAAIQSATGLSLNNVLHNYNILHGILTVDIDFYIDDPVQPNIISMALIGNHVGGIEYISGVPTLSLGDSLLSTFTVTNAVSWFYNKVTFGRVESPYTNDANTGLVTGKNNGDNVVVAAFITSIIDTVYTENADITAFGFNSRYGTSEEIVTDTGSNTTTGTSGDIRIDTISDETIRLTSGAGQYPVIAGGAAGQVFNSITALTTAGNEELQLVNGRFIYPTEDYTGNNPTAGPDYSSVPAGTFNGIRWTTFSLGSIVAQTSVEFDILGRMGFNGNPIESGDYALYVIVDGDTGWLDANVAYPGSGNPVSNGDPALDLGSSSISHKRVTFGTTPRSGDVYVRIGWASTQIREITLIQ